MCLNFRDHVTAAKSPNGMLEPKGQVPSMIDAESLGIYGVLRSTPCESPWNYSLLLSHYGPTSSIT
jgi:hypothetical protein